MEAVRSRRRAQRRRDGRGPGLAGKEGADVTVLRVRIDDDRHRDVIVEFDVDDQSGWQPLANRSDVVDAPFTLSSALDQCLPALACLMEKVRSTVREVDEVSLDLGLRIGGEGGLVFVKGSADATIRATVTWRRPRGEADDDG
jgi:hypothetical protein